MIESVVLRDDVVIPSEIVDRLVSQSDTEHTAAWFVALAAIVDEWCRRWRIKLDPNLPRLSYNVVIFGESASLGPVVLKLSPPHREFLAELEGLLASQGPGVVTIHDARPEQAGMLLERVIPGVALQDLPATYNDDEATRIAAACLQRYWRPAPIELGNLITLERWFRDLFDYEALLASGSAQGPLSHSLAQAAVDEARILLASTDERAVLHGDLHHDNILTNRDGGWTIIDPKGLVGDRIYDVGTWMLNPPDIHRDPHLKDLLRHRVEVFSEVLGIPRERIIGGAIVHSVLSACWSLVDAGGDEDVIAQDEWLESSLFCARAMLEIRDEA
ncbi:MAG: aminoglycoside phosphotransferase family protein [Thermomicrobiales bacterium]